MMKHVRVQREPKVEKTQTFALELRVQRHNGIVPDGNANGKWNGGAHRHWVPLAAKEGRGRNATGFLESVHFVESMMQNKS
jgi:hypothetical protein